MSALAILETGLMLGLYALFAGVWGILYTLAHLRKTRTFGHSATTAYALHAFTALAIILQTPLGPGWRCLIAGSSLVILAIPPVTWRFLQHTHRHRGLGNDGEPSQHPARVVARL